MIVSWCQVSNFSGISWQEQAMFEAIEMNSDLDGHAKPNLYRASTLSNNSQEGKSPNSDILYWL